MWRVQLTILTINCQPGSRNTGNDCVANLFLCIAFKSVTASYLVYESALLLPRYRIKLRLVESALASTRFSVNSLVCAALVLSAAIGCSSEHSSAQNQYILKQLLEKKDVQLLAHLLVSNNGAIGGVPTKHQVVGPVEVAMHVNCEGEDFVVIISHWRCDSAENAIGAEPQVAFIFDLQGQLLATLGGNVAIDGQNADRIILLNLGTRNSWFVWVTRFEPHEQFEKQSDIYILARPFPRALRVFHHANAVSFTTDSKQVKRTGPFFMFECSESATLNDTGLARDGKEGQPILYWNHQERKFQGPSRIKRGDSICFEVDLNTSVGFSATDLASHADECDSALRPGVIPPR
jgi:hypothetical protein